KGNEVPHAACSIGNRRPSRFVRCRMKGAAEPLALAQFRYGELQKALCLDVRVGPIVAERDTVEGGQSSLPQILEMDHLRLGDDHVIDQTFCPLGPSTVS